MKFKCYFQHLQSRFLDFRIFGFILKFCIIINHKTSLVQGIEHSCLCRQVCRKYFILFFKSKWPKSPAYWNGQHENKSTKICARRISSDEVKLCISLFNIGRKPAPTESMGYDCRTCVDDQSVTSKSTEVSSSSFLWSMFTVRSDRNRTNSTF